MATSQPADGAAVSSRTLGGPDLRPPALSFCDMLAHAGHELTVRVYKARGVAIHGRIGKERQLSIMIENGTNLALFEAFWSQLQTGDYTAISTT